MCSQPSIGLALSGGGSRAIAFHIGCLRALRKLGLLEKVRTISTISGGSVIGAYYAYTPYLSLDEFEQNTRIMLKTGFKDKIISGILEPTTFIRCFFDLVSAWDATFRSFRKNEMTQYTRHYTRTDIFQRILDRELFAGIKMSSPRRDGVQTIIGACDLIKGVAFRYGNDSAGSWIHKQLVDWDVDVSFAVAASAAYPLFLPAMDRRLKFDDSDTIKEHRVLLSDGGIYDNLGLQVLEPGRDNTISIHTSDLDYLIVCNAGYGRDIPTVLPTTLIPRVSRTFGIIHQRTHDHAMDKLHNMKSNGNIRGFILPYLGQNDTRLPWKHDECLRREDVIDYPTDFSSMSDEWINKLSRRGEELTTGMARYYLSDLVSQTTGNNPASCI